MFKKALPLLPLLTIFCGGYLLQAAVPEGFELVWSDEFEYTGAPDPTKWTHELGGGGWGNGEVQIYTDDAKNSRVEGGKLIIETHQEPGSRLPGYSSARLITREKAQWKYGRIEFSAKMPSETGTWPAVWMLAADNLHSIIDWPNNGEIDILETVGYEEDPIFKQLVGNNELPNVHGTLHTDVANGQPDTQLPTGFETFLPSASTAFNTYAINWLEDRIEWEVNGVVYGTANRADLIPLRNPPEDLSPYWPFDQRFFLILNVAVGGGWGGHFNTANEDYSEISPYGIDGIDHDGIWPQRMEVEYIRVYSTPPEAIPSPVPGLVTAKEMDADTGILVYKTISNTESAHRLNYVDAGDRAEFALEAPQAGLYSLSASIANTAPGTALAVEILETGSAIPEVNLPSTAGLDNWQTINLGTVQLQQGLNTLELTTSTGDFTLAWFNLEAAAGGTWKGLNIDAFGNADTQSWLEWINVTYAPWLYSYSLNKYIYFSVANEELFHTDSQWIYVPKF